MFEWALGAVLARGAKTGLLVLAALAAWPNSQASAAEHCFAKGTTWLETANTGRQGYWRFVPSPNPMGPVDTLPLTCFQQDMRFSVENGRQRLFLVQPESAAAQKCSKQVDPLNFEWIGDWDESVSDWQLTVSAGELSRSFSVQCTIESGDVRKLRLMPTVLPGKGGEISYVWSANE